VANQPLIESYTGKITEWVFRRYRSLTQHSRCLDLHLHTQDDTGDPSSQAANQHTFNDVLDDAIADDDNPSGRCAPADILLAPGESRSLQQAECIRLHNSTLHRQLKLILVSLHARALYYGCTQLTRKSIKFQPITLRAALQGSLKGALSLVK